MKSKKLTAIGLLDILLRREDYSELKNKHRVIFGSYTPEHITLCYVLKEQQSADMDELRLWANDAEIEGFMEEFGIASMGDLDKVTLEDLWYLYSDNRAHLMYYSPQSNQYVPMTTLDGINSIEEALVFAPKKLKKVV